MNIELKDFLINMLFKGSIECIALTMFTLAILKIRFEWRKIILIALTISLVVSLFRTLWLSTGLHTAFAILTMALLVSSFFKVSKLRSIIASMITMLVLGISEFLWFLVCKQFFGLDINDLAQNILLWTFNSWVYSFLIAFLAIFITRTSWFRENK